MNPKRLSFLVGLGTLVVISAVFYFFGERTPAGQGDSDATSVADQAQTSRKKFDEPTAKEFDNVSLKVGYVGDAKCAECHLAESESFRKHPMGRSMTTVKQLKPPATKEPFTVDGFRYSVRTEGDRVIHVEERLDPSGEVLEKKEEDVTLVVGSGARGHAFLTDHKGSLFQSPVSWYSSNKKYDLAPGYHARNLHFDRQIRQGCIHCHANEAKEEPSGALAIHGLTIGCERCHGPGEVHSAQQKVADGYDRTIVNPAKLTPTRRDQVCYQCHLQLDAREEIEGKSVVDYRPGADLYEFVKRLETPQSDPYMQRKSLGHAHQMEESKCYTESEGRLGCMSCHNPHAWTTKLEDRIVLHNRKCMSCHETVNTCSLPAPERLQKSPGDSCVSCHMPTRQATDIGHTVMTDHRITKTSQSAGTAPAPKAP